ncbi:uncharacterized protein K452DRAFT_25941 [Aplosporella prunicola CBS 121167]|uniref:Kinesin-like protein n=1 Tax=Aplosporella prunicola CBS 121167 TaxID=1176127 RepID=A0A6A6BET2_9PEZI|nr:uncharacterized protein K452DRAFT_25941 [Aplosporella prunicola CBS 121167]KAF2142058.1 hypothetical protein K452DRAFT_25941 [Aplosporella prunicola CBS 121167]
MAAIPRPSLNPPDAPLPALPVPKTRSPASPERRMSAQPSSPSTLPTRPQPKAQSNSTSNLPTTSQIRGPLAAATPAKGLRKTISIGSFPQPPKGVNRISHPPSPLSAGTTSDGTTTDRRSSLGSTGVPSRKPGSARARGQSSTKSPLGSPSLLVEAVDRRLALNGSFANSSPPESPGYPSQESYDTELDDSGEAEKMSSEQESPGTGGRSSTHKDGKGNVVVSVRVRPDAGGSEAPRESEWMVDGRRGLIAYRGREGGDYFSDNVFTAQDNNARVYDAAAKRLVRRVMEGYHGTVFAYGMTGTGKTFSMQGTTTSPGVIPLAITDIFSFIRETPHREFLLRVSYLEIYNEKIHDLLANPTGTGPLAGPQEEIKLREDSKRGVYATPLKEEIVQSPTQLLRVIARGDQCRRVAGTQFNARSSRSHAVVQIVVESRERVPGGGTLQDSKRSAIAPGGVRVSTLSLIDLAGSERAADDKERRAEGAHINKSLLTLGTVIARLSEHKDKDAERDKHLPYRDSKLTRLLQPALSGNSLVSILCTVQIGFSGSVASTNTHINETLSTLKFASRAKNSIVSHAKKAEEAHAADPNSRALLDRYRMEIAELRKQLENKTKEETVARVMEEERAREVEAEVRHEEQMLEMQLARTALKERIEHLNRLILSSRSIGVNSRRSFTSLGARYRNSIMSNSEPHTVSVRNSMASQMALEVPNLNRTSSGGSAMSFPPSLGQEAGENGSEEEESLGDNGDGTASPAAHIQALQVDLADKNRYISTLEKRLLQARRTSQSRMSMALSHSGRLTALGIEEGRIESLLKEKDEEIAELRAQLEDKDRMVAALRSAARKRDVADLTVDTSVAALENRRAAVRRSGSTASSSYFYNSGKSWATSPGGLLSPRSEKDSREVEDITKMLDDMLSFRPAHDS